MDSDTTPSMEPINLQNGEHIYDRRIESNKRLNYFFGVPGKGQPFIAATYDGDDRMMPHPTIKPRLND
jgi:hypothetical protein